MGDARRGLNLRLLLIAVLLFALVILGGFARDAGVFAPWDIPALLSAEAGRDGALGRGFSKAMVLASTAGNGLPRALLIALVSAVLIIRRQFRVMAWFCGANVGGALLNESIKHMFEIPRPRVTEWLASPKSFSYPSGHAANAVLVFGAIGLLIRKQAAWIAIVVVAFLIGFSRVWLGVHTPSDIMAGWMLGIAWLCGYAAVLGSPRFTLPQSNR